MDFFIALFGILYCVYEVNKEKKEKKDREKRLDEYTKYGMTLRQTAEEVSWAWETLWSGEWKTILGNYINDFRTGNDSFDLKDKEVVKLLLATKGKLYENVWSSIGIVYDPVGVNRSVKFYKAIETAIRDSGKKDFTFLFIDDSGINKPTSTGVYTGRLDCSPLAVRYKCARRL